MKKKFSILRVIGLFLLALALFVSGSLAWELHSYTAGTPRITPYEDVTISVGQTVTPDDIALIEKAHNDKKFTYVIWENGSIDGITLAEDSSSFTVTEGKGVLEVTVFARKGDNGEDAYKTVKVAVS